MLSIFKSNNPFVVIFYLLYIALFRVCFAFFTVDTSFVFEQQEPLSQIVFGFLKSFDPHYLAISLSLSGILCFIQALLINGLVNEHKLTAKKNYLPGLLFIIFSSFFKESLLLSPALIALTFIIICTAQMFSLIKKEKAYSQIFDMGFLVAIATLFYFPAILFIIFAYFGLGAIRAFSYREWVAVAMGFISPIFVTITWYFWYDKSALLLHDLADTYSKSITLNSIFTTYQWLTIVLLTLLSGIILSLLPTALYSSLIQVRKYAASLFMLLFLIIASVFIDLAIHRAVNISHFVLVALPLSIFASMVLMQIKRTFIGEVMHIILILLVLVAQFLPLSNIF